MQKFQEKPEPESPARKTSGTWPDRWGSECRLHGGLSQNLRENRNEFREIQRGSDLIGMDQPPVLIIMLQRLACPAAPLQCEPPQSDQSEFSEEISDIEVNGRLLAI